MLEDNLQLLSLKCSGIVFRMKKILPEKLRSWYLLCPGRTLMRLRM